MKVLPAALRDRFLILFAIIFVLGGAAGYSVFVWYNDEIVRTLGRRFAERNALYEKSKLLRLLVREVTLAQKLASSPLLKAWIGKESDRNARVQAIAEMEDYRRLFRSRSTFIALAGSGNYYYSDDKGERDATTPRYTLSPSIAKDRWFYQTLRDVPELQLNVDTDRHLHVTRVWINAVLRDENNQAVAVGGSGVDLGDFIANVVSSHQPGVTNVLLDADGAIQAHQNVSMIDFASIRKTSLKEEQSTLFNLLERDADRRELKAAMDALIAGRNEVDTLELTVQGRRQMTGITWVPEVRWFVVTLTNPEAVAGNAVFPGAGVALVIALAGAALIAVLIFQHSVLRRLSRLDAAARALATGGTDIRLNDSSPDELGRLARNFSDMAQKIVSHTTDLERQVAERTAKLEAMAQTDFLTQLLNRRGMVARLDADRNRESRQRGKIALLLADIDNFKNINDRYGHAVGDQVIVAVAGVLRGNVRDYDACARWGGEEFLIGMSGLTDDAELQAALDKLLLAVRSLRIEGVAEGLTVSVGAVLAAPEESLDSMLLRADGALYAAKHGGRDRSVIAA